MLTEMGAVVGIFMLASPSLALQGPGGAGGSGDLGDHGDLAGNSRPDFTNHTGYGNSSVNNDTAREQMAINQITAGYVAKCENGEEQIKKTVTEMFKLGRMTRGSENCSVLLAEKKSEICGQYEITTASATVLEDTDCGDDNPNLDADPMFTQFLSQGPCKHADLEKTCSASDEGVSTDDPIDDGGGDDDQSDDKEGDAADDEKGDAADDAGGKGGSDAGGKGGSDADAKGGSSRQYQVASLLLVFSVMLVHPARVLCL